MKPETYTFTCSDGQHLSQILYLEYGYVDSELLFEVIDLNIGVSEKPLLLTAGTQIQLPKKDPPIVPSIPIQTLWD